MLRIVGNNASVFLKREVLDNLVLNISQVESKVSYSLFWIHANTKQRYAKFIHSVTFSHVKQWNCDGILVSVSGTAKHSLKK